MLRFVLEGVGSLLLGKSSQRMTHLSTANVTGAAEVLVPMEWKGCKCRPEYESRHSMVQLNVFF